MNATAATELQALITTSSQLLRHALNLDVASARLEAQLLLAHLLDKPRAYLATHPEVSLDAKRACAFHTLISRRAKGEPVAYILGYREFYGLKFMVSPAVLIPRPETELLVDLALQCLPRTGSARVLDLGTGSGAIALSIATHRPQASVTAIDKNMAALEIAAQNKHRLGIQNVRLLYSDWFSELEGQQFDLIVANPPYVGIQDPHLDKGDVRFEPPIALSSGYDGLSAIREIVKNSAVHLSSRASFFIEHGYDQACAVQQLLHERGFRNIQAYADPAGIKRVSGAQSVSYPSL